MYKILGIYHNGRKDTRMKPVDDLKYDGLVGSRMLWDMDNIKQFAPTVFKILDNGPLLWYTSEILQLTRIDTSVYGLEPSSVIYVLETAYTIYQLEELDGDELLSDDQ